MSRERVDPAPSCLFQTLSSIRRTLDLETEPGAAGCHAVIMLPSCCHHAAITLLKRSAGTVVPYRTVLPGQTLKTPQKTRLRRRVLPPITGCASDSLLAVPTDLLLNHPHRPRPLCTTTLTRSRQASNQSINRSISKATTNDAHHVDHQRNRKNQYINPANLEFFPS
jgi:hypothetical protein